MPYVRKEPEVRFFRRVRKSEESGCWGAGSQKQLADKFGISQATAWAIITRKTWKRVKN